MPRHNEILTGELGEILADRLAMQGGQPAPTLAPEIIPTLPLEVDRPEWVYLGGGRLWGSAVLQVGAAGEQTIGAIENPAGSGIIAVFEQIMTNVNTTSRVRLSSTRTYTATGLDDTHLAIPRDTRQWLDLPTAASPDSALLIRSGDVVGGIMPGVTNYLHIFASPAGTESKPYPGPIVLVPGTALLWETDTNNIQVHMSLTWRERKAQKGELVV